MIYLSPGLYVVVEEVSGEHAPPPLPLASGFSEHVAYRVLGVHAPSETGEAYFILSNDRDEVWFISNRHFRTHVLRPECDRLRIPAEGPPRGRQEAAPSDGRTARADG